MIKERIKKSSKTRTPYLSFNSLVNNEADIEINNDINIKNEHVKVILPQNYKIGKLYFSDMQFHGGSKRQNKNHAGYWTFVAAVIDGLILIAASCFFLILTALIFQNLYKAVFSDLQFALASIFVLLTVVYLVCSRFFYAATLGESTCSLRLGQPTERFKKDYVLRVLLRTLLIFATGFVTLPIFSFILKKDLAGHAVNLKLYRL